MIRTNRKTWIKDSCRLSDAAGSLELHLNKAGCAQENTTISFQESDRINLKSTKCWPWNERHGGGMEKPGGKFSEGERKVESEQGETLGMKDHWEVHWEWNEKENGKPNLREEGEAWIRKGEKNVHT